MSPSDAIEECWYGISDPRKRKQIQDRLAQRARRRRLAGHKDTVEEQQQQQQVTSSSASDSNESHQQECLPTSRSQELLITMDKTAREQQRFLWSSVSTEYPDSSTPPSLDELYTIIPEVVSELSLMPVDQRAFPRPQLSVFALLWDNGAMLGISCCCGFIAKSKPVGAEIPLSLHPTPLQLAKLHLSWIDRFPFPRMRDNMISLSGVFDEEDFLEDLFKQYSFTVVPGGLSYDPRAWRIGREFAHKWGYLFY